MAVSRLGDKIITCLYLRDLTSRILIERELQKTNAFFNNIIQNSVDGIVVVDTKGVPLIFNQGAERMLGYTGRGDDRQCGEFPPFLSGGVGRRDDAADAQR